MKNIMIILLSIVATSQIAFAATYASYCTDVAGNPRPKYKESSGLVMKAAKSLSAIADISFYFYSGPLKAYGLKSGGGAGPAEAPAGVTNMAHNFLTILCGEFRDRPSMIEAKLNWALNIYKLPATKQISKFDMSKSIWSQVSAESYGPYRQFSSSLWQARKQKAGQLSIGGTKVDAPVEGTLICEVKYIFDQYIGAGKSFDSLNNYDSGYSKFAATKGNCSADDKNYYYDFRGDSNFKPNSPESNGMIWYSSSIAGQCATTSTVKSGAKIKAADCVKYFKTPFTARWDANRAGAGTWFFHSDKFDFSNTKDPVYILPDQSGKTKPFSYKFDDAVHNELVTGYSATKSWKLADMGFNAQFTDAQSVYERLKDAVNRHTDWYASGFDDGMGMTRDQAYSPFVASSYEMNVSDEFTAPGVTVNSPSDGKKQWMFVFRIKKENWINTAKIAKGAQIDFDNNWFDETSIGTVGLAKSEHAWDRLGTPQEDELDSIIYLHNITSSGSIQDDGLPDPGGN